MCRRGGGSSSRGEWRATYLTLKEIWVVHKGASGACNGRVRALRSSPGRAALYIHRIDRGGPCWLGALTGSGTDGRLENRCEGRLDAAGKTGRQMIACGGCRRRIKVGRHRIGERTYRTDPRPAERWFGGGRRRGRRLQRTLREQGSRNASRLRRLGIDNDLGRRLQKACLKKRAMTT